MPENEKEAVPAAARPRPKKRGSGAKVMFVILIVLALAGVIVYLLSLLNSKTFFLVPENGELVVKKGIFFPVGSEVYLPKDPEQAALYKPIDIPDALKHAGPIEFEDLPSLNREFAKYLIDLATKMVFAEDESQYTKGKGYLERVRKLHGLDPEQVDRVKSLRADVDYIEAKRAYLGVEKILESALRKFRQAETFGSGRFGDAKEWIDKIQTLMDAIRATKAGRVPDPVKGLVPAPLVPADGSTEPAETEGDIEKAKEGTSTQPALPPDGI